MKQAVIAPSMLCLLYPLEGEIEGYSREQFLDDLVDECEKDIRKCFKGSSQLLRFMDFLGADSDTTYSRCPQSFYRFYRRYSPCPLSPATWCRRQASWVLTRSNIYMLVGRLALRNDPRNPWTGRNMLESFIELNNRVFARFSAKERKNIGIHTCPGGDCDSVHSLDVDYSAL